MWCYKMKAVALSLFLALSGSNAQPKERPCHDGSADCSNWARAGECAKNPGFMHSTCKLSCGLCQPAGTGDAPGPWVGPTPGVQSQEQPLAPDSSQEQPPQEKLQEQPANPNPDQPQQEQQQQEQPREQPQPAPVAEPAGLAAALESVRTLLSGRAGKPLLWTAAALLLSILWVGGHRGWDARKARKAAADAACRSGAVKPGSGSLTT